jgi:nucleoid DNA-binding protein
MRPGPLTLTLVNAPNAPASFDVEIAGITVDGIEVKEATSGQTASLLLRGIDKKDIRRGMVFAGSVPEDPGPPVSDCFSYTVGEDIAAVAAKACGLPYESVLVALQVAKDTIMNTVAAGYAVDIDGFGVFYVQAEKVLSVVDPGTDLSAAKKKSVKFKAGADLATSVNK